MFTTTIPTTTISTSIWDLLLEIEGLGPIDDQRAYPVEKSRIEEIRIHNESLTPVIKKDSERVSLQLNKWERRLNFMIRELNLALCEEKGEDKEEPLPF